MSYVYVRGNVATITLTIKNLSGALVDVGTITLTIQRADGVTEGPFTPNHDSTGTYHEDYVTAAKGWCKYRFETTNPTTAAEGAFNVVSAF